MINFDTSRPLPTGTTGWQELLTAISESAATDETIWVEHKAGLDPATKNGGAALAKAIVAFGNRNVAGAARHLGGHAIVVVGLEAGSTSGTAPIDPAKLRDNVDRYIAAPAPVWDSVQHTYNGQNVLVVIVDPPRDGDPIFVLGKGGGDPDEKIRDGAIYVRRPRKSDLATSAEIRKLEARAEAGRVIAPVLDIDISPTSAEYAIPWLDDLDSTWVDRYVESRRIQLLRSLDPEPTTPTRLSRLYGSTVRDARRALELQMSTLGATWHDESRTEEEFRAEVDAWAEKATPGLTKYLNDQRHHYALPLDLSVRNNTQRNYVSLRVEIHITGPVRAYDYRLGKVRPLTELAGREPRKWGPWRSVPNSTPCDASPLTRPS